MPHPKFFIAGALILGAIGYLMFSGINSSMVYYYTVSELLEKAPELQGRGLRLSGHVASGTIERNDRLSQVRFRVVEKATGKTVPVVYEGIIPDTFKDHAEVVVEGKYELGAKTFRANTLLAKCPSKYEGQLEEAEKGYSGEAKASPAT